MYITIAQMIETQEDLRAAQEKIKQLEKGSCPEDVSHLEELQHQNRQLSEELDNVRAERDGLLSSASCTMSTVTGLTEERDQLKDILEALRQEKTQLREDLEANLETVTTSFLSSLTWPGPSPSGLRIITLFIFTHILRITGKARHRHES